jgi:hypothetical protein
MKVETPLELYDYYVVNELKKKHNSFNANWIFAPAQQEIGFRYAAEAFGKNKIFPIFFVFRGEPAKSHENTSAAKYAVMFNLDDKRAISTISTMITYQIDFYSNTMFDMNKFNLDFFRFQKSRFIEFDFSDIGVNYKNQHETMFEDIEANHTTEDMFNVGRYFHYVYRINLVVPLFDVSVEVPIDKITIGVYTQTLNPETLVTKVSKTN